MKEVLFEQTGKPLEVLKLQDAPVPNPGEGEVLIRVTARNINPADMMFIQGLYGIQPQFPSSAGFEACGVLESSGSKLSKGTRVLFSTTGTWREYLALPEASLIPIPDGMPDEVATQAIVNPMTAYLMIEKSGLKADEWLLITAGASAFGKFAIQLAKKKGIKVACTVRHDEQKEILKKLGADLVVNTEKEKLQKVVPEHTDGGVHVVFDAVGGLLGAKALASLRKNGLMMVFGSLSLENIPLNSGLMIFKTLRIEGFWLTSLMSEIKSEARNKAFQEVFEFLMNHSSQVDVAEKYPLEEFEEAIKAYEKAGRNGKILLIS
ncbi:zinc-dependent alcohol dehydrogenase family protein [Algoriphagus halophilus]|uniref:NADPH:quinone reductase n=1 Tax=Algoriphagus halophilus TaxID=226505 RepID=A0A1N6DPP8_9BACT|nr:zinc-dependent alcohol dehydrogenase family protein [Algoriphagus halophilus]SIN72781.1 NADPH:quinone reductase [Algoriphagus halophilus]